MRERKMKTRLKKIQKLASELAELGYSFSERDTDIVLIDDTVEVKVISLGSFSYGTTSGFQCTTEVVGTLYG